MSKNKISVLFWVHVFPAFSETFIRDQVCRILDEGHDVFIYGKSFGQNQQGTLKGFDQYHLINRFVSSQDIRTTETTKNKYLAYLKKIYTLWKCKRFSLSKYIGYVIKNRSLNVQAICLAYFCAKNTISVIHAHFGPNGELATVLKQIGLQIKIVTTFHGYDVRLGLEKPGIYEGLKKDGDAIISISSYNKKILLDIGFKVDVLYDLPNAVNTDFYCPKPNKQNTSDVISIITVARLVEEKSIHIAIKALKIVKDRAPQYAFSYTIVGEGELRSPIEALIKEANLQDEISLVGVKNSMEVRDALQKSAIFVLSSSREALPTVLMEAQATGLVVVATDVGSVSDIVVHGIIVPSNDIEAMANGIITTFKDRVNWDAKGLKNRDYIVSNYNSHKLTQKLIKIYGE